MSEAVVIKAYQSAYPDPLNLQKGDKIAVEERDSEWSGWLWATDKNGKQGWVPESLVERDGNSGIMTRDYDATELTVNEGERLYIIEHESGWCRCRKESGEIGWIPEEHLSF